MLCARYAFVIIVVACAMPAVAGVSDSSAPQTFHDVRTAFYQAYPTADAEDADGEWARFKRWEWFMEPRVGRNGAFPRPTALLDALNAYQLSHATGQPTIAAASGARWTSLGPASLSNASSWNNGGIGRVSCIRFQKTPSPNSVIYVGTPEGGLWRHEDSTGWIPLTDHLPNLGVTDVAVDPRNGNVLYIGSGDGDAAGMYGNPYSYGVMKSTDRGATWAMSGLTFNVPDKMTIARVVVSPANSNIVLAAVTGNLGQYRGIYRSTNAGASWTLVDGGAVYCIEYKPDNPAIVYASGYGNVRKSLDSGATWSTISSASLPHYPADGVSRTALAVTPAQPNVVYVMYVKNSAFYGLYKSTDAGTTWTKQSDASGRNVVGSQGDYALSLAVSPTNAAQVFAGGLYLYMSSNSGASWQYISNTMHVDQHCAAFPPGNGTTLYAGNDGGIYKSTDVGKNWEDITAGLQITQYYRLGCAATNPRLGYAGAQDNGVHKWDNGDWSIAQAGADGADCVVDPTDENSVYMEFQNGYMFHSNDGAASVNYIAPDSNGNWITPIVIDPVTHTTVYTAYRNVYKSTDEGSTWSQISPALVSWDNLKSLSVAPSNNRVIYTGTYLKIFKSSNAGTSWKDISAGLPIGDTVALTSICVHPNNPNWAWITFASFIDSQKVYKTTDGGATWTNVSGTLPNVPVNCAIYEKGTNDVVYIGTDVGVFWRNNTMDDWQPYMEGLPNVAVMDLEIQTTARALRAATFGRGVWESPLRGAQAPSSPVLVAPADDSAGLAFAVGLQWKPVDHTANYTVQVDTTPLFAAPLRKLTVVGSISTTNVYGLAQGDVYYWRVAAENAAGASAWSPVWHFTMGPRVGVDPSAMRPVGIALEQNHPNPFSAATTFRFITTAAARATLTVTNLLGQTVAVPFDERTEPGLHEITWRAGALPSGIYRYQLQVNGDVVVRTMRVLR